MKNGTNGYSMLIGVIFGLVLSGCATGEVAEDDVDKDVESAEVVVESLLGDEILVDGGDTARAEPGESIELPVGEREIVVVVDDDRSERVTVDVVADRVETVEIPWHVLPVQHQKEIVFPVVDEETRQKLRAGSKNRSGRLVDELGMEPVKKPVMDRESMEMFADVSRGDETVAGQPLDVERADLLAGDHGLRLRAGDRLFAIDGEPIEDIEAVVDAVNDVASGEGDRSLTLLRDGEKWSIDYIGDPLSREAQQQLIEEAVEESSSDDSYAIEPFGIEEGDSTGEMSVYSRPVGAIFVDGEETGFETPMTLELEAGVHSISVQFDDETEEKTVEVEADERRNVFFENEE